MLDISLLKSGRNAPLPNPVEAQKALNPALHPVNDPVLRRDKQVQTSEGTRLERVARIALPLQQLIIKRSVAFLFGTPVRYECDSEDSLVGLLVLLILTVALIAHRSTKEEGYRALDDKLL